MAYDVMKQEYSDISISLSGIAERLNLAGQIIDLPSPPSILMRILQAVQGDSHSFAELGKIISVDPALVAKLLKMANSSMYGLSGRIKTIESALAILGTNTLKNIALSFVIVQQMHGESDSVFDFQYFWKRSVTAAVAAKLLAPLADIDSDDAFVSTLLQDVGVLVFFHHHADAYMEVMALKNNFATPGHVLERKMLGLCHAELGGTLLKGWGLPESIYRPVLYHHRCPDSVPEAYRVKVNTLALADRISAVYHGSRSCVGITEIVRRLSDRYGLAKESARELIDKAAEQSSEIMEFFDIPDCNIMPMSKMLQEANRELSKLNCSYEQLILELKQAKEESYRHINKLTKANKKYRELAYRDELTSLYNNRYFQQTLDFELARAERYQHAISLLFLDIDCFKEINDRHGHLAGDMVLQHVAAQILQIMRATDIVVRYGGDEFAVILPETDRDGAVGFAERVRGGIEKESVTIDGAQLQVTVSVGSATASGTKHGLDKASLLDAADKALYQGKHKGRNQTIHVKL